MPPVVIAGIAFLPGLFEMVVWLAVVIATVTLHRRSRQAMFLVYAAASCFFLRVGFLVVVGVITGSVLDFDPTLTEGLIGVSLIVSASLRALQFVLLFLAVVVDRDEAEVGSPVEDVA